ncbi:unnamed protein product [Diplocarpon coronariae]|uniref:Uncharacterized protein n=1 Tax=Diplocarpon coronariae TaxID=2795749 RepID=A0A218Z999_9HELO|nr:hypothetical protein B2J93_5690 [Marssonina coronariae]
MNSPNPAQGPAGVLDDKLARMFSALGLGDQSLSPSQKPKSRRRSLPRCKKLLGIFQALERDIESKLAAAEISPRDLQLLESLPAVVPIKQKMIVLLGRGGTPCPGGDNFVEVLRRFTAYLEAMIAGFETGGDRGADPMDESGD